MSSNYVMHTHEKNVKTVGQNYIVVEDVQQMHTMQQEALIIFTNMDVNYSKKELNAQSW